MNRPTSSRLCTALLTALVAASVLACEAEAPAQIEAPASTPREASAVTAGAEPGVEVAALELPEIEAQPILASARSPRPSPTMVAAASPSSSAPSEPSAPSLDRRERAPDSLRHPSLLPADTPEANVVAFTRLPIAKRDAAPVGGVGASGVHLDELEVGKGWGSSRCEELGGAFEVGVDERVNVCFRVVHPREAETVTLEWARDGELRQTIQIGVKETHAYLTRGWLPVTAGRAGQWTATVKSEGGFVLGQVEFEIVAD